ncbi:hypothetical protein [Paraburkholderia fungorum]|jgi:hypothetical protein|uniref:Uncharacterized protein n=1 Tax=Paraburkholderia fungorum TaxID=134537 RepID=A0AAW3V2S6_9BURK|nr:hypothetical protein [Paraburkholderia fungorum]AJZ56241.1 hypothetical protein OI25_7989 [Paraburkholderia fungorum]MBB4519902.1 hypothetical protein [Paraburkholderia fungorum]MBB5546793.1 hypothetical protein [Paraburkholderia fungorum]MBB6205232.1 hypothetical protein [Paraburkholderia fungorum]MBU7442979.1 hypothetical protein [Paraburkholderia fungorum]
MAAEELVARTYGETWSATPAGRRAREARWQERGRRHPALSAPAADLEDLALAVIASGGEEHDALAGRGLKESTLGVYLFRFGEARCASVVGTLILRELVRRAHQDMFDLVPTLILTADGRRHYAQQVVGRLGLRPPATILAQVEAERLPFDDLGLEVTLADNLRFRWEEAERCVGARAWLAASALYGSILEVILLGWLQRDPARATQANSTPRDRAGQVKPLDRWTLAELITVATELDFIDASHARHAQALRESRNLIHPHKQIRERSTPDGRLALISQNVVGAVLEALARATGKGAVA